MSVAIIPFKMPDPMEIPVHIVSMLRGLPGDEAVKRGMELLMEIDAAETIVYERFGEGEVLEPGCVIGSGAEELEGVLKKDYGQSMGSESSLGARALADLSPLLVMGQAKAGEQELPAGLLGFLLADAQEADIGFIYVLPLTGKDGRSFGVLTLIRPADTGPLNHDQPNITEGMCRELSAILDR